MNSDACWPFDTLDEQAEWFDLTSTASTASTPSECSYQPEDFNRFIDKASSDLRQQYIAPSFDQLAEIDFTFDFDLDWCSTLVSPPPTTECHSVYSNTATPTGGHSPFSIASSITTADSPAPLTPSEPIVDNSCTMNIDKQRVLELPADQEGKSDFKQPLSSVTYPMLPKPLIETVTRTSSFLPGLAACGQPLPQLLPGAAAAFAFGEMRMQADPTSSAHKRTADASDDEKADGKKKPAKRRRKQDTAKTLLCPECGSGWARRNNLDKHIRSVHQGMRPFVCPAGGCARAFSRKHDMQRHFQSNHTNMGSPRRKAASK